MPNSILRSTIALALLICLAVPVLASAGRGSTVDARTVNVKADLSLSKSVAPANARPGETVIYTLIVRNDGPAVARDVVLTDSVPAGVTFVSSTPATPDCKYAATVLSCALGSLNSGTSKTVTVRASVDALKLPADHQHLIPVDKVEQQVDLQPGQLRSFSLSCPQPDAIMTDATVRVDAVDQGTGTLGSVETRRARSSGRGSYEFGVANSAAGRAQAKLFGVCMPSVTQTEQGHTHGVLVGDPITVTKTLGSGRYDVTVPCGPGTVAIAPGIDVSSGRARLVGSEPSGNGRVFTVEVATDPTTLGLSVRCMSTRLGETAGHTHDLRLSEVKRTVTVPANSTVSESAICADDGKGIVASYNLGTGLYLAGHDPQPKSRVFKIVNPTGQPVSATIDLLCVGDRTSGPIATKTIVNSASVASTTPDPDLEDRKASATLVVSTTSAGSPAGGTASLDGGSAKVDGGGGTVAVPLSCADDDCAGSLTLRTTARSTVLMPGSIVGSGGFALDQGEARKAKVRLKGFAAKLVKRGKLRKVKATVTYADGATTSGTLKLK